MSQARGTGHLKRAENAAFSTNKEHFFFLGKNLYDDITCVASVFNRVIARNLEREQKSWKGEEEGRRGNACLQTSRFWKTPLGNSGFGSFVN